MCLNPPQQRSGVRHEATPRCSRPVTGRLCTNPRKDNSRNAASWRDAKSSWPLDDSKTVYSRDSP